MDESDLVSLAQRIATQAHSGQFRRGGEVPYIRHPEDVASRMGADAHEQTVAWLHDVIEDCDVTAEDLLNQGIPDRCVDAIVLMTKSKGVAYEDYLERICSNPLATRVKIADMISNLADNPTNKQLKKYAKGLTRLTRDL